MSELMTLLRRLLRRRFRGFRDEWAMALEAHFFQHLGG